MLKKIAIVFVIAIAAVLGLAATKPATFRVERKAAIKAPAAKVFDLVNDFHKWPEWSPWEKLDPNMKRTHSGAASGKGAIYGWEGNDQVGKGRMEIVESTPPSKVSIQLDFLSPFEAHNTAEFAFAEKDGMTDVTWAMFGANNFLSKVMTVFCSMDAMVGKDFETGLANLKTAAEK